MDTQQVTEKLFNFCKEKYPDLDWNYSKECSKTVCPVVFISGSCPLFKLELKIVEDWLRIECIRGYLNLQDINFRGCFLVQLNDDKDSELEFYRSDFNETTKPLDKNKWNLCKKARKIVREIFNFIEDEIQE
jgi:hypothetical protein